MSNLNKKKQEVAILREKFEGAKSAVITDYCGLNVAEVTELRANLRNAGVEFKVVKNTLLTIAANEAGIEGTEEYFKGPTAIAYGVTDAVAPAQIISKFAKDHKNLEVKAGILEGKVISQAQVDALANLPSREVLLTQFAGLLQAPIVGLVNVLQGPIRKMGYALEEVRKAKELEA
ncbi:LSU ribosomal protein L10P [Desulfonispora thiosulfatigenes DSM 11270]|uniref:Large ribosomal subunit protein uL10 n=1 Tax=Desulfonispora thiosulfatigenes DSM 11270 TaxID=656914 RepID=A0A1W1UTC1_DESTI|nr:50S ribosomal protein L10 [Desulfonispora thiosulfatigenes]SMB84290.1 LSU ribosomal protein L10P [Desulfonispora thiosulfatigenes DSM 11270]